MPPFWAGGRRLALIAQYGLGEQDFAGHGRAVDAARHFGPKGQQRELPRDHSGPIHGREAAEHFNGFEQVFGPVGAVVVGLGQ
ncbi:MAG: hypothetical protein WKG07_05490 [Hymenobacter sp.]